MFWYGGRYLMELLCMYSFVYLRVRTFIYIYWGYVCLCWPHIYVLLVKAKLELWVRG